MIILRALSDFTAELDGRFDEITLKSGNEITLTAKVTELYGSPQDDWFTFENGRLTIIGAVNKTQTGTRLTLS